MYYRAAQLEFPFIKDIQLKEKQYYYNPEHSIYNELTKELQELALTKILDDVKLDKIKRESRKIWEIG